MPGRLLFVLHLRVIRKDILLADYHFFHEYNLEEPTFHFQEKFEILVYFFLRNFLGKKNHKAKEDNVSNKKSREGGCHGKGSKRRENEGPSKEARGWCGSCF